MTPEQASALAAIDACVVATAEAARVLRASLTVVEPPAPEPPPVEPPAPEPPAPPPPVKPTGIVREPMNLQRMVCFADWHGGSIYERFQRYTQWRPGQITVKARRIRMQSTGTNYLPARQYTLLVDDVPMATASAASGAANFTFKFDGAGLANGWRRLSIGGLSDGETCPTWFAFMLRDSPNSDLMPVCTGSYDITQDRKDAVHGWAMVPARYTPTAKPLPPQDYPDVTQATQIRAQWLVPGGSGNRTMPNVTSDGVWTTFCRQGYFWDDMTMEFPRVALLDGPRGIGTMVCPTHIEPGRATLTADSSSARMNTAYVLDPWRLTRVGDDGRITTLVGWRHRGNVPSNWQGTQDLELVGDWSGIKPGLHEAWGMAWDRSTLAVDTQADTIPHEQDRQPHAGIGPACVITDSQNGRLLHVQFDGHSHATPARVTELVTGMADPWDVVAWGDGYIVSERAANRIIEIDRAGALRRVVIERNPSLPGDATLRPTNPRKMVRVGTLAEAQAQPVLGPEGLAVMDDWLYFGSFVQEQVRRVHLLTGELQVRIDSEFKDPAAKPTAPPIALLDNNSKFIKLCVSDGSFGPRHGVVVASWSVVAARSPRVMHLPDGSIWKFSHDMPWSTGYGSAAGIGGGRLFAGSSQYGLLRHSAGPAWDAKLYAQGEAEFDALHGRQLYGPQAACYQGQPAPRGVSAALDYYLDAVGCVQSAPPPPAPPPVEPPAPEPPPAPPPVEPPVPSPAGLRMPDEPTVIGSNTQWYLGGFELDGPGHFDSDGWPYAACYSRKIKLPAEPRLSITLHSSGGYGTFVESPSAPVTGCDIEVRTQDGQVKKRADSRAPSEYWCYAMDGQPYPMRRVVALLEMIVERYPQIDLDRGIVLNGNSMGNGGVLMLMLMTEPWRSLIAFCAGGVPVLMPRPIKRRDPGKFNGWPADSGSTAALWDAVDFEIQSAVNPIVRGMHYRMQFSSNDTSSEGDNGSTHLQFVRLCAQHRLGLVASWVQAGHNATEKGVSFPSIKLMGTGQDVTVDRAHPAFSRSTGNWPVDMEDITDRVTYPRGHYNLGITWQHAGIVDTADEIAFPIRYVHRTGIGGEVPDQPEQITVDVTPRRARRFALRDGETLRWTCGEQNGTAVVHGDTVTAEGISLVSGAGFKSLRFYNV